MTKDFPTLDVLSTVTGRLMAESGIGGVYEVLNFMTGESVFTHQIPRIGREATKVMVARQPALAQAVEEADQVNPENWREWAATWLDRYGPTITVPRMNVDEHESIDPLSELAEKVPPERRIVIALDEKQKR
jgi:hypothetical protein